MEKSSHNLLDEIEKVFLGQHFIKNGSDFENKNVKYVYANYDPEVGHGYFLRVNDELVETIYISNQKSISELFRTLSSYGYR